MRLDSSPTKQDDLVQMIFVTIHNFIPAGIVTRQRASEYITSWYTARVDHFTNAPNAAEAKGWLEQGTFAFKLMTDDGEDLSACAVALEHVIAMYTREISPPPGEEWKTEY